jgi:hypothetical protein
MVLSSSPPSWGFGLAHRLDHYRGLTSWAPAVAPVEESADDEDGGGEAERGVAMAGASVGVAAKLPVVRPPGVGGLNDPAQAESDGLLLDAGDLGAAELDVELGDPVAAETLAYGAGVVAPVECSMPMSSSSPA